MNFKKITYSLLSLVLIGSIIVFAADHIDAPAVSGTDADITDYYAFEGASSSNLVFVANVQGLLSPSATADADFNENTMIQFNIDNTGDNVEDLVIQVIFADGVAYAYGPVAPSETGLTSGVEFNATNNASVAITEYGNTANIGTNNGISLFAGPRDDPFFMDFAQYGEIIAGNASSFNDPGADTFAGTNVMSVVVEVPKSTLGSAETINTWVQAKNRIN
ncbi:MAG TPA: molecular chaperone DnaK [Balneola sp.]|jgi:hypothetical protein|nr:molecular chaperone DnaK [Bacteroidota bacterium]MAC04039.1 molecular chaperone DnaK [Balneola sp.]MAO78046.1 molecular chaperone DnaK [Balneola sp.]MBF64047.1 molecular chaperone DnaK [Balneola sp.]HBZ37752.1 molecular chaperone DnaK [Balneola sp.]|tara:strand:+ start:7537 stop:8196 length:660 start_codon:yes stop_codon:yes gene_type:complete